VVVLAHRDVSLYGAPDCIYHFGVKRAHDVEDLHLVVWWLEQHPDSLGATPTTGGWSLSRELPGHRLASQSARALSVGLGIDLGNPNHGSTGEALGAEALLLGRRSDECFATRWPSDSVWLRIAPSPPNSTDPAGIAVAETLRAPLGGLINNEVDAADGWSAAIYLVFGVVERYGLIAKFRC